MMMMMMMMMKNEFSLWKEFISDQKLRKMKVIHVSYYYACLDNDNNVLLGNDNGSREWMMMKGSGW